MRKEDAIWDSLSREECIFEESVATCGSYVYLATLSRFFTFPYRIRDEGKTMRRV